MAERETGRERAREKREENKEGLGQREPLRMGSSRNAGAGLARTGPRVVWVGEPMTPSVNTLRCLPVRASDLRGVCAGRRLQASGY